MKLNNELISLLNNAWLGLTSEDIKNGKLTHPLKKHTLESEYPGITPLMAMRNPAYFGYATSTLLNLDILPLQACILNEIFYRPFPMLIGSRGLSKSTMLAIYALMKMGLTPPNSAGGPGVKIVIVSAGFRQAKQVFQYAEEIYENSKILKSINGPTDRCVTRENDRFSITIGKNTCIAIPIGNGEKIRGLRANVILVDEFSSIDPDIFQTVIQGFATVSAGNPIDTVKAKAKYQKAKELGIDIPPPEVKSNQIVISGTADYEFQHFAAEWKKYKAIIESGGDLSSVQEIADTKEDLKAEDFSIIRIPYDLIPEGFLDSKIVARAEATNHTGTFNNEYGAIFSKDSNGFFKRSLIESCVASPRNVDKPEWPKHIGVFDPLTVGNPDKKYVIGVDPASEVDNCAIVVVEENPTYAKVIYSWTINKKRFRNLVRLGFTQETDFYAFVARKIRSLLVAFPCSHIGIDSQGGGIAVMEALHNKNNIEETEQPIWTIVDKDNPQDTDTERGLHIIEPIVFAKSEWVSEANHGLRFDMESKVLVFPFFDSIALEIAFVKDMEKFGDFEKQYPGVDAKPYDTLEDITYEIEELKDELSTITISRTGTGSQSRDKWDTPEVKGKDGKKGRLRKDRYSALLIANMIARQNRINKGVIEASSFGNSIDKVTGKAGEMFDRIPDDIRKDYEDFLNSL